MARKMLPLASKAPSQITDPHRSQITHTHTCMHAQTNSPFPFPLKTLKGEDTHRTHL